MPQKDGTAYETLHDFTDGPGGWAPYGVIDGNDEYLYGMTTGGGFN